MRSDFIIFLSVVLSVYISVNYYIFLRGWQAFSRFPAARIIYAFIFILLFLSFFAGRILERYKICLVSDTAIWTGSFWLGFMAYLFFGILIIDILRVMNHFFRFFPSIVTVNYEKTKIVAALVVIALGTIVVAAGYINAHIPRIKKLEFTVSKNAGNLKSLRIAMASDIHLGTIISNSRLERLVTSINNLKPDIILLAGDIVDEDIEPVIKNNLGELLNKFSSVYGTYAVTGNHEYIGGAEEAAKYLSDHRITMLRDRAVKIGASFYLAGRDDRSGARHTGKKRRPLKSILNGIDSSLPVILMDHQPFGLGEAAEASVDLQFSGHTHNGQLWPFNFITSAIYEVSHGYARIRDTYYYVSSGYGTWGPPIRTSGRPEILDIVLRFKD